MYSWVRRGEEGRGSVGIEGGKSAIFG